MRARGTAITAATFLALGGLAFVLAGPVAARTRVHKSVSVTLVGSLTIAWQGDQARGCAAEGLCNVSGAIQMLPSGGVAVAGGPPPIELTDQNSAARVIELSANGAPEISCADVVPVDFFFRIERAAGALRAAATAGGPQQLPSAGRCAGPTAEDMHALALAARSLGSRGYDLSGQTTFGAGPFTVTAISTLQAKYGGGGSGILSSVVTTSTSSSSTPATTRTRTKLVEHAAAEYRIAGGSGAFTTTFAGMPTPFCDPLGACETTGQLRQAFAAGGVLNFSGSRVVKHRMGSATAVADLRSGRLGLGESFGQASLAGTTAESLMRADGPTCADGSGSETTLMEGPRAHGMVQLTLAPGGPFLGLSAGATDPLRTRCPGPSTADVLGESSLATAIVHASMLRANRFAVTFPSAGSFSAGAYSGGRSGSVVLTLVLVHAGGGTTREPAGAFPVPRP